MTTLFVPVFATPQGPPGTASATTAGSAATAAARTGPAPRRYDAAPLQFVPQRLAQRNELVVWQRSQHAIKFFRRDFSHIISAPVNVVVT